MSEDLLGELGGGLDAWVAGVRPTSQPPVVDAAGMAVTVIDIRQVAATGQNLEATP